MHVLRLWAAISLLLTSVAHAESPPEKRASFHIQAHRGAGIALPENTLESFCWSWKRHVTPEADLRTTKDGVIVCFHDANFKRVVHNGSELIESASIETLTLAEVQKLDVGSFRGRDFANQRVPTLASAFSELQGQPDQLLYIDVKNVDLDNLAMTVKQHRVERQVIFTTSEHPLIREWKKRVPESMSLLWNNGNEDELTEKLDALRKTGFDGITHFQVHVQVGDLAGAEPFMPSTAFLKSLGRELAERDIVFQALPWKCSDRRAYGSLLALGVDSFATDYPEVTLEAVQRFGDKHQERAGM